MNEGYYKGWHTWYVTKWREPDLDEPLLPHRVMQREILPGFRCSREPLPALLLVRTRLERIWSDLIYVVDGELALGFRWCRYYDRLKELREFLDEEGERCDHLWRWGVEADQFARFTESALSVETERVKRVLKETASLLTEYAQELNRLALLERMLVPSTR